MILTAISDVTTHLGDGICSPLITAKFLADDENFKQFKGLKHARLRTLLSKAQNIIYGRHLEPHVTPTLVHEKKLKRYSNALLRGVFELLGVDDSEITNLRLK